MLNWQVHAQEHSKQCYPEEACGLVYIFKGKTKYKPCKNISINPKDTFIIDPLEYAEIFDKASIIGVFHSHPNEQPYPTSADKAICEKYKYKWHIYSVDFNKWYSFEPSGYKAPLVGREYVFGIHDCWSLIRDHFENLNIKLRDWDRPINPKDFCDNPYFENCFVKTGFRELKPDEGLKENDCILFSLNSTGLNHIGVLLKNQMILHHIEGRVSSKDFYGEWLMKCTGKRIRYVK
tara:strand:+ start:227 stop:931 length:705 start_codon:yes stop_codon:yes gene_type:complete